MTSELDPRWIDSELAKLGEPETGVTPVTAFTGTEALDAVHEWLGRFVAYPDENSHVAHTLWIAHAHLVAEFENTPRIAFLSPEPGSGKSRALEVTEPLVPNAVQTINASPSYVFRKISDPEGAPTLLFDEVDAIFNQRKADANEDLRGLLNSGYRRGATAGRAVVRGKEVFTEDYPTFAAVALAGLGDLPDTIMTRSIVVRMKRRRADEHVEPYRRRLTRDRARDLYGILAAWADSVRPTVGESYPELPEGIEDRDADVWEPLIQVADAAGGDWPHRARVAAVALVKAAHEKPATLGIRLLADVRRVFGDAETLFSEDLVERLSELDEAPWGNLRGEGIDQGFIARTLGKYDIHPRRVRMSGIQKRGYERADLFDAWARYLPAVEPASVPVEGVTPVTPVTPEPASHPAEGVTCVTPVSPEPTSPRPETPVTPVTPISGTEREPTATDALPADWLMFPGKTICSVCGSDLLAQPSWKPSLCGDRHRVRGAA